MTLPQVDLGFPSEREKRDGSVRSEREKTERKKTGTGEKKQGRVS
jgi:hypothetical protein